MLATLLVSCGNTADTGNSGALTEGDKNTLPTDDKNAFPDDEIADNGNEIPNNTPNNDNSDNLTPDNNENGNTENNDNITDGGNGEQIPEGDGNEELPGGNGEQIPEGDGNEELPGGNGEQIPDGDGNEELPGGNGEQIPEGDGNEELPGGNGEQIPDGDGNEELPGGNGEQIPEESKPEENIPFGTAVGYRFNDLTLKTLDGTYVNTADLRGKVIIFNIWATWCPPCKAELPDFNAVASEYADDVVIIAAHAYDEYAADMPSYVASNFPNTKIIFAYDNATSDAYAAAGGIGYVPQTAIIDKDGIIRYSDSGRLSYYSLISLIQGLIV